MGGYGYGKREAEADAEPGYGYGSYGGYGYGRSYGGYGGYRSYGGYGYGKRDAEPGYDMVDMVMEDLMLVTEATDMVVTVMESRPTSKSKYDCSKYQLNLYMRIFFFLEINI